MPDLIQQDSSSRADITTTAPSGESIANPNPSTSGQECNHLESATLSDPPSALKLETPALAKSTLSSLPRPGMRKSNARRVAFLRQASLPLRSDPPGQQGHQEADQTPPLHTRWLYNSTDGGKPWSAFRAGDSRKLEESWKSWKEQEDGVSRSGTESGEGPQEGKDMPTGHEGKSDGKGREQEQEGAKDSCWKAPDPGEPLPIHKVPVAQDRLYEVDLKTMKRSDVLRASWFYEGSKLLPCNLELAEELEEHYRTIQPWRSFYTDELKSSLSLGAEAEDKLKCPLKCLKGSYVIFQGPRLARLYSQDFSNRISKQFFTAWSGEHGGGQLLARGYQTTIQLMEARKNPSGSSKKSGSAARKPSQSRGMKESTTQAKTEASKVGLESPTPEGVAQPSADPENMSKPPDPESSLTKSGTRSSSDKERPKSSEWNRELLLKSVASKLGEWGVPFNAKPQQDSAESSVKAPAETVGGKRVVGEATSDQQSDVEYDDGTDHEGGAVTEMEEENNEPVEADATDDGGSENDEVIDDDPIKFDRDEEMRDMEEEKHPPACVLVIHGIGQRLSEGWKSFDFLHAVNSFRSLVQKRATSAKPPSDIGGGGIPAIADGKRVQLLPILWRASFLDEDETKHEDADGLDNGERLQMDDVFGEDRIPLIKTITRDVLLDIPMYLSRHRPAIVKSVIKEANRQYRLFCQRNPDFEQRGGKVHMIAHSLGSALACDILSDQPTLVPPLSSCPPSDLLTDSKLLFNIESLFTIGSPVALFFVLNRAQLIARRGRERTSGDAVEEDAALDRVGRYGCLAVSRIYNCWNYTDPVAFRLSACVDVKYGKPIPPVPINKATRAMLRTVVDPLENESEVEGGAVTGQGPASGTASSSFFSSWSKKSAAAVIAPATKRLRNSGKGKGGADGTALTTTVGTLSESGGFESGSKIQGEEEEVKGVRWMMDKFVSPRKPTTSVTGDPVTVVQREETTTDDDDEVIGSVDAEDGADEKDVSSKRRGTDRDSAGVQEDSGPSRTLRPSRSVKSLRATIESSGGGGLGVLNSSKKESSPSPRPSGLSDSENEKKGEKEETGKNGQADKIVRMEVEEALRTDLVARMEEDESNMEGKGGRKDRRLVDGGQKGMEDQKEVVTGRGSLGGRDDGKERIKRDRCMRRLLALSPLARVDFVIPLEGSILSNQYTVSPSRVIMLWKASLLSPPSFRSRLTLSTVPSFVGGAATPKDILTSHGSYWSKVDFADFVITQLLATEDQIEMARSFKQVEGWE
ncbi:hypothetical protein IE53DRAFT_363266 [Violaceomyces palustris]|uniref:Uncharacterized protein n=1 Tax=Violaceomyces palustris TaxID=1673888 RepID=A0ACD0NU74_9BASI|nr:hypothetical protein IE53DRAFT_363266 [Violaceomyces palustris]